MSLDPRSIGPAWNCSLSVVTDTRLWATDTCLCETGPVHSLSIGDARVALDLRSGVGYEHDLGRGVLRRLSPAECRLVLLDWTRDMMPVRSPRALWTVEAASLAAAGSEPHWRAWASVLLHEALAALLDSPIEWSDRGRELLVDLAGSASVDPGSVDGAALGVLVRELEEAVAARWDYGLESVPAPEVVSGCSEVEWDRVRPAAIDLGELGLRSRIFGTVWTASVGQCRLGRREEPGRLWARLVDDASGTLYDEVEMRLVDGVWSVRGYVPPAARKTTTRVDLTADQTSPARGHAERRQVLWEQGWYRYLHCERRQVSDSAWTVWRETYRSRVGVEVSGWDRCWWRPFLAERHLRPTDLASGRRCLLSPDPAKTALFES